MDLYEPHLLPDQVRSLIEDETHEVFVSHVSVLELTDKASKFRLPAAGFSVDRIIVRIRGLRSH